jgi:hypothetical protein
MAAKQKYDNHLLENLGIRDMTNTNYGSGLHEEI